MLGRPLASVVANITSGVELGGKGGLHPAVGQTWVGASPPSPQGHSCFQLVGGFPRRPGIPVAAQTHRTTAALKGNRWIAWSRSMSEATSGACNCGLRVYMHLRRERLPPGAREGGLCPEGCHLVFPHLAGPKKGPPLVPAGPGDDAREHSTTVPLQPGSPASISPSRGPIW